MPDPLVNPQEDDENYISSEDEDFNLESAGPQPQGSSSSEAEEEDENDTRTTLKVQRKKPKPKPQDEAEDLGFENSGDEGIIKAGTKEARRRKRKRKGSAGHGDDSGGEGGFVQTRSMRAAADPSTTRKLQPSLPSGPVTADIDALWARLSSSSIIPTSTQTLTQPAETNNTASAGSTDPSSDLIPIQRTYTFAGRLHTETKLVPRSSAQAEAYLATKDSRASANKENIHPLPTDSNTTTDNLLDQSSSKEDPSTPTESAKPQKRGPDHQLLFRPLRRQSHWDPNPDALVRGLPPPIDEKGSRAATVDPRLLFRRIDKTRLGRDAAACWPLSSSSSTTITTTTESKGKGREDASSREPPSMRVAGAAKHLKAQRLNVVDKSKLDWAEHVDAQEGAREELEKAKRDKGSYLDRRDFLERVEERGESSRSGMKGK
ncbi:hypothetical protein MMC10_003633 [Thelotrema lepadinum]|nr:hypothetical protein [Thelotrema lepadinum]